MLFILFKTPMIKTDNRALFVFLPVVLDYDIKVFLSIDDNHGHGYSQL
jgi:hypothetical protein